VKFTKDYAMEINKRVAEDAGFRSAFMSSVKRAAIERYGCGVWLVLGYWLVLWFS
jgi:hypothetical protein